MLTPHARPVRVAALAATLIAAPLALCAVPAQALTGPAVAAADTTYGYTVRLDIGNSTRGCSGVLVDPEWLLTAASCFVDDPAAGLTVPAGAPKLATTATIGRADLTGTAGVVRNVVELVPRTDRDLVLARLSGPATGVNPIALATTAPTVGEELRVAGYGRTKDEWAPLALHTGAFSVDASDATTASVTGKDGVSVCPGDTGGPEIRVTGGNAQLVAINSRSWQGGCYGIDATETRTGAVATRVDDLGSWITSKVNATQVNDFNGDGIEDIAVADPEATVGTQTKAGLVRIVYGGGKGTAEITQDLSWVPGSAETGDGFGAALATVDYNQDGYTDLVVGTPHEDVGSAADAGFVDVLYGGSGGFGTGPATLHLEQGTGSGAILGSTPEAGDLMGYSLAAGATAAGEPWLVIGVPGESLGTVTKAGEVFYLRGTTNVAVHQEKTDVPGTAEANDGFGTSVAGDANHIAVGIPSEKIGTLAASGGLAVFDHKLNAGGIPTPLAGIDQDTDGITGAAEAGDQFGASLSMTEYRPAGATAATDSILAVGSPGESLTVSDVDKANAGRVVTLRITAAGVVSQIGDISQEGDGVTGTAEVGDRFGERVAVMNTAPRALSTAATMRLAVGIPGEAIGTATKSGAIQTFSLLGAPGDSDYWIEAGGASGLPGAPATNQQVGISIAATGTSLYVGMPYGPSAYGAVHVLPWSNATGGTAAAITTYAPGTGGLPAAGVRFGAVVK
ncbi:trypsin-like serine protease [Streptomyces sp. NPDC091209]|uniref:trypsin-like serine protease n=1 Tax=Streptomyces sp. NPDC091209 TaxID=3365974 RepID=UPI003803B00C